MFGVQMGTLNVYTRIGNQLGSPIYFLSGNHGNKWAMVQVTVTSPSSWQVRYVAKSKKGTVMDPAET